MNKYEKAIEDRGFATTMETGFKGESWAKSVIETMRLIDTKRGYRLYKLEGWRKYSRHCTHYQSIRYITGVERGQYWANRVPGNIDTISDALEWLKPAEVKKAKGKVIRQGDVFIVEKTKDCKSSLPDRHDWDIETRILKHPEHHNIQIPFPCKFIPVRELRSGMGGD